jgi:hypothetical protein
LARANTSAYFAIASNDEGKNRFMTLTAGEDFEEEKLKGFFLIQIVYEFSFNKKTVEMFIF